MRPREAVQKHLRLHPRVAYQKLCSAERREKLAQQLPDLEPFGGAKYCGVIAVLDWDHRLPSRTMILRLNCFTSDDALRRGERAYEGRVEEIGRRDKFPEFDVPDFDGLPADEAYDCDVSLEGELSRARLTSTWRRDISDNDADAAVEVARRSDEFRKLRSELSARPSHLGDLEAVGWCPPCESDLAVWTLDVWYLTSFDGQIGRGKSLLVDLSARKVLAVREFTVRVG